MFSLRSSMRLWGNSTKRMFHNRPVQNTSGQLLQKASEYFDNPRFFWICFATYAGTVVCAFTHINVQVGILERRDEELKEIYKELEEMDKQEERYKELDKELEKLKRVF